MVSHLNQFLESLNKLNTGVQSIQESVKDDPELTRKFLQASETYQLNSVHLTELLNLMNSSNLQALSTSVESVKTSLVALDQSVAAQSQKSASMAWSFGSRMTAMENAQASLEAKVSTIQKDTSDIKTMMTEIYQAFKGSSPSASVGPTLAITSAQATVEGENNATDAAFIEAPEASTSQPMATNVASKGQPSHTEGEHFTEATPISSYQPHEAIVSPSLRQDKGKNILTTPEPEIVLKPASTLVSMTLMNPSKLHLKSMK